MSFQSQNRIRVVGLWPSFNPLVCSHASASQICHFCTTLEKIRIILAASVLTVYLMSFLILSLRDEALVIHRTFHELLQKQEEP